MRVLSSEEVLGAWESCAAQRPVERAITLLSLAGVERDVAERLSIGERDAHLLALHTNTFGPTLEAFVECPTCAEPLEFSADTGALGHVDAASVPSRTLELPGAVVELRPLDSRDLAAAAAASDDDGADAILLERGVVTLERGGTPAPLGELTAEERNAIEARLAEIDPRADLLLDLVCPACGTGWRAPLDIEAFVVSEVSVLARRLLRQVAALATAFGWTEREVLALTPARRRAYLELAGA